MKAIITSTFHVRDNPVSSYYSFPVFSEEIEKTMIRQLDFLERTKVNYSLDLKIVKNNS